MFSIFECLWVAFLVKFYNWQLLEAIVVQLLILYSVNISLVVTAFS